MQLDSPLGEVAQSELWPLHIGENGDRAFVTLFQTADDLDALAMLAMRSMAEVQPENVHSGFEKLSETRLAAAARTDRRDDLGTGEASHLANIAEQATVMPAGMACIGIRARLGSASQGHILAPAALQTLNTQS